MKYSVPIKGENERIEKTAYFYDMADRKTEPQTERLCDNCKYYGGGEVCDHPSIGEVEMGGKGDTFPWIKETPKWCPLKTEPQTCNDCDQQRCETCVTEIGKDEPQTSTISEDNSTISEKVQLKDEPQTCSVNGRPYDCENCEYFRCTADEPQTGRSE